MPEQNDKSQMTVRMAFDFPADLFSAWVRVMHWSLPQRDMQQILFAALESYVQADPRSQYALPPAKQQSLDLLLKEAAKMTDAAILLG